MCLSYRSLTDKELTVRKNHMCEWCSETIYKGQTSRYRSYVFDGELTSGHLHLECYAALASSDREAICEGLDAWGLGARREREMVRDSIVMILLISLIISLVYGETM